ncbi:NUDIX domain-containing protein [Nannocystis sp.]|uniref:NUDIX domain-containing protein n=1 Tax=Nannocystis sp. TaxID=1962667 RepID=UPI0025FC24B9|nr:NUDIX domain-containing protein [Nannocystis sp.]MBK7827019.1 NUDIX domain-containing protein [Nannocystis sp.]
MKSTHSGTTTAYMPGRFSPPTRGHIQTMLWLLDQYDRLVIGIGSCYEVGTVRHPLLASIREKMVLASLHAAGASLRRVRVVHLTDFPDDWDGWWRHTTSIPGIADVTHFVTGNEADILAVMRAKGLELPFALINPEKEDLGAFRFAYHATDLRRAIVEGNYARFRLIAAEGTINLMGLVGGFAGIRRAMQDAGTRFVPGRQAADAVVTCEHAGRRWLLCGYRREGDFSNVLAIPGGGINVYESPVDAALRKLADETGLVFEVMNRGVEPIHLRLGGTRLCELRTLGILSTEDPRLGGSRGGSAQAFHIALDCAPEDLGPLPDGERSGLYDVAFRPEEDVAAAGLAFQQMRSVQAAGLCHDSGPIR